MVPKLFFILMDRPFVVLVTATALRGEHITEAVIDKWSRRLESNPRIEVSTS